MTEGSSPRLKIRIPPGLDGLYDRSYYNGLTSGYPAEGYRSAHPDWAAWMDIIGEFQPGGTLLDLGCAYGFLIQEARRRGYRAFGLDVSRFALTQAPRRHRFNAQGNAERIPTAKDSADIITVFDLLEHLVDPASCVREIGRVLKRDGVVIGSTPDPIFFKGHEATHFFERPPSYWIRLFEEEGFEFVFRFSDVDYNFQFAAAPAGFRTAARIRTFRHDFIGAGEDFVHTSGEALAAVPRTGWGPLENRFRRIARSPASVYLLNRSNTPAKLDIRLDIRNTQEQSASIRIRLDSHVLEEVHLSPEGKTASCRWLNVPLPAGGHHLYFDLLPEGPAVTVGNIRITAESMSCDELVHQLPFDLFQRYELAGRIGGILPQKSVLDVGGVLGDAYGHLATSRDFLSRRTARTCFSTDLRHCDIPDHAPAEAWDQPFDDHAFDLVVSLDVLEHLPPPRRTDFLEECFRVARKFVLIGAPFDSPEVRRAEEELRSGVLEQHGFLDEHREMGLPDPELIREFARRKGCGIIRLAGSYIPRWKEFQVLTQHLFALRDSALIREFNTLYNHYFFEEDQREPGYRTLFLICKKPLTDRQRQRLEALNRKPAPVAHARDRLVSDPRFHHLFVRARTVLENKAAALTDSQFLVNSRQAFIRLLEQEREDLAAANRSLVGEQNALLRDRKALLDQLKNLLEDRAALAADRDALKQSRDLLASERDALLKVQKDWLDEREALLREKDELASENRLLDQERIRLRADRDRLRVERDAHAAERSRLEADRDAYRRERMALAGERERIAAELDAVAQARDEISARIAEVEELNDALKVELDTVTAEVKALRLQSENLIRERAAIDRDRFLIREDRDALRRETDRLNARLRHTPIYKLALQRWFSRPETPLELEGPPPRVTAFIINYNGRDFLEELITSLQAQTYRDFEVRMIDNGSSDDSISYVESSFPRVKVMAMNENIGFARAGNLAVRSCLSPYVIFLNSDLKLEPRWLEELVAAADSDPSVAAVAPKMLLYDRPHLINGVGGAMNYLGYTWDRGMLEEDRGQYDEPAEVIFAPAAAALFRREAFIRVGLFDERYFMYHEDVDLGWRLWIAGHRIITAPKAVAYHHFGGTTKESKGMAWRELIGERNNIRALLKNYSFGKSLKAVRDLALLPQPGRRKLGQIRNLLWNLVFYPETYMYRRRIQRKRVRSDGDLERLIVQSKDVLVRI